MNKKRIAQFLILCSFVSLAASCGSKDNVDDMPNDTTPENGVSTDNVGYPHYGGGRLMARP
ncbi:MAG: hypothetical protein HFE63_01345 [Clostridiales bacterium]|nr:hypothetical protein [Clostridiales bacterium]